MHVNVHLENQAPVVELLHVSSEGHKSKCAGSGRTERQPVGLEEWDSEIG